MVLPALKPVSKHLKHTRNALVTLRQAGDVRGWFGLVQKGRPKSTPKSINPINPINPIIIPNNGAAAGAVPGTAAAADATVP